MEAVGAMLNRAFKQRSVKFLGPLVVGDGVWADSERSSATREMETPQSNLGMVNQPGKFSYKSLSYLNHYKKLLSTNQARSWGPDQEQAFN